MTPGLVRSWRGLREGSAAAWPSRADVMGLRPAPRFVLLGLGAWTATALILSAAMLSGLFGPPAPAQPPAALTGAGAREAGVAFEQRPLFAKTRRPAFEAPPPSPIVAAPTRDRSISLTGIFIDGSYARALMASGSDLKGRWLAPNDMIAGWTIASLSPDAVHLTGGGETFTVGLHASAPTAGAAPGGPGLPEELRRVVAGPMQTPGNPEATRPGPTLMLRGLKIPGAPAP